MHRDINDSVAAKYLWENAREGMALLSDAGIIKEVNPALCAILGYSDIELIGKHFTEITHTADNAIEATKFQQLIEGRIPGYSMGKRWRTKLGKVVPGELTVKRWIDGVLIYGAVMPLDPVVRAVMGDSDAQKMIDESLGRWLRTVPAKIAKNWRFWVLVGSALVGGLGYKEVLGLLQ